MKVGGTTFDTYFINLGALERGFLKVEPHFPIKNKIIKGGKKE